MICNHNLGGIFTGVIAFHKDFRLRDMDICKCHLISKAAKTSADALVRKLSFQATAQHLQLVQLDFSEDTAQTVQP